jgi:RNA polymerase sigma factor (sigma-70 family)
MADEPGAPAGRDVHDDETDASWDSAAWDALPSVLDGSRTLDRDPSRRADRPAHDRRLHSDPHDFAGLYIRHRAAFTLHARHYLRDERDADEVVQEAFLRLFLALPELETELQALAYCRRTITNLCIDRYRAQARRPHLVHLDSVPLEEIPGEDTGDPVVRAEDAALVREALSLLSPMHRAALVKREIEEKTLPVIADELEIPEESVKHLLFRARRALRRLLAGTSLAPGADGEAARAPGATARAGSGGLAALVLAVVLGIGSGPNLEAIPVVGVDLPDVIDVTSLAKTVGSAVTHAVDAVAPPGDDDSSPVREVPQPAPRPAASPSDSSAGPAGAEIPPPPSSASALATAVTPAPAPAPVTVPAPAPAPAVPAPSPVPAEQAAEDSSAEASPSPEPSASPQGSQEPSPIASASPAATPSGSASPEPTESAPASPAPTTSPQSSPSPVPTAVTSEAPRVADTLPVERRLERTRSASSPAEVPGPWR